MKTTLADIVDPESDGEDGAKAKRLLKEMKKERFVKLLYYMIDVTAVLGCPSREFQNEDLSLQMRRGVVL